MTISTETRRYPAFTMGDRLRKARELTGMDRKEFAETIGIHRDSLAKYEADKQPPRPPVVAAWALSTGVDVGWLRTGVASEEGPDEPSGQSPRKITVWLLRSGRDYLHSPLELVAA